jgi:hypothetical protein
MSEAAAPGASGAPAAPAPAMSAPQGVTQPAPPAAQPQAQQPTPQPAEQLSAAPGTTVNVLPEVWVGLNKEVTELRAKEAARQAEIDAKAADALREKARAAGLEQQVDELNAAHRQRYEELNSKYQRQEAEILTKALSAEINEALTHVQLVEIPNVDPSIIAAQARKLLIEGVEAIRDGAGNVKVQDKKTMQPAAQWLKERLASPEMAIYIKAQGRGGSGTGLAAAAPPPGVPGTQPGSLDNIVADWKNRQSAYQSMGMRGIGRN